jgi:hypothetical protein
MQSISTIGLDIAMPMKRREFLIVLGGASRMPPAQ